MRPEVWTPVSGLSRVGTAFLGGCSGAYSGRPKSNVPLRTTFEGVKNGTPEVARHIRCSENEAGEWEVGTVRSEEDILMEVPKPVGDWRPIVRAAQKALGPGHGHQWLAWNSGLADSTFARYWATGKAPTQRVDRIFTTLREEAEAHLRGDCTKGRYLSLDRLGDVLRPSFAPQRATARLTIAESIPVRVAA